MIGLDVVGPLLVLAAIVLMSVAPLQLTIARSKAKAAWVGAMAGDDGGASAPSTDCDAVATEVPAASTGDSPPPAQARSRAVPGIFEPI